MELPGGLWEHDRRRRDFAFRPMTGELELAVGDPGGESLPARVTAALAASLATLGGGPPSPERVRALCVDDRRFLMYRLAGELGIDELWLTATCPECEARFDICVEPAQLPVKPAGDTFPFAGSGERRIRVPTGDDQEAVARMSPGAARRELLRRCLVDGGEVTDADDPPLEAALEAVSPEVARELIAVCPSCETTVAVPLDPYACLGAGLEALLDEVDVLARAYHWSEAEILGLSHRRRQRYLARASAGSLE